MSKLILEQAVLQKTLMTAEMNALLLHKTSSTKRIHYCLACSPYQPIINADPIIHALCSINTYSYIFLFYSILLPFLFFSVVPYLEIKPLFNHSHQRFDALFFRSFKSFKTADVESLVKARLGDVRSQRVSEEDQFLVIAPEDSFWESEGEEAVKKAARTIANSNSDDPNELMKSYLSKSTDEQLIIYPSNVDFKSYIPSKVPVLDLLAFDSGRPDAWKYPPEQTLVEFQKTRATTYSVLDSCHVEEIIIGETSPQEIMELKAWMLKRITDDHLIMPLAVTGLSVKFVSLPEHYYSEVLSGSHTNDYIVIGGAKGGDTTGASNSRLLPTKIMIGNGSSWALVITFRLKCLKGGRYELLNCALLPELINLLKSIPCCACATAEEISTLEEFISDISESPFAFAGHVLVETLATLAGWKLKEKSLGAMNVIILGGGCTPDNKRVERQMGSWTELWKFTPEALKVKAVADLRSIYRVYTVLMGSLLRDAFPDPDICCLLSDCTQNDFVWWLCKVVVLDISGLRGNPDSAADASDRKWLTLSITKSDGTTPTGIAVWAKLLGKWPTITYGGCRYLHQARAEHVKAFQLFKANAVFMSKQMFSMEITDDVVKMATFGMHILDDPYIWGDPAPSSGTRLTVHRSHSSGLFKINTAQATPKALLKESKSCDKTTRHGVYEWCRVNILSIPMFLDRYNTNKDFRSWFKSYYDDLRKMFANVTMEPAPRVDSVEKLLRENTERLIKVEANEIENLESELRIRRRRLDILEASLVSPDDYRKIGFNPNLPAVPARKVDVSLKRPADTSIDKLRKQSTSGEPIEKRNVLTDDQTPRTCSLKESTPLESILTDGQSQAGGDPYSLEEQEACVLHLFMDQEELESL